MAPLAVRRNNFGGFLSCDPTDDALAVSERPITVWTIASGVVLGILMSGSLLALGGGILLWAMASGLEIRWQQAPVPDPVSAAVLTDKKTANTDQVDAAPLTVSPAIPKAQDEALEKQLNDLMNEETPVRKVVRPGRSRDECLKESKGVANERYARCRSGWEEPVSGEH